MTPPDEEVACRAAHGDGAVGQRGEQPVGQPLIAGHARVGEVLVEDERGAGSARGQPAEVGRRISVHVEDGRAPLPGQPDQVAEDARIETAAPEVTDRDALFFQQPRRGLGPL